VRKVGGVGDSLAWAARLPPTLTIFSHIARRQGLSFLQARLLSLNQMSNDNTLSGVLWLKASAHCLGTNGTGPLMQAAPDPDFIDPVNAARFDIVHTEDCCGVCILITIVLRC
jgi:hypothetical protein